MTRPLPQHAKNLSRIPLPGHPLPAAPFVLLPCLTAWMPAGCTACSHNQLSMQESGNSIAQVFLIVISCSSHALMKQIAKSGMSLAIHDANRLQRAVIHA